MAEHDRSKRTHGDAVDVEPDCSIRTSRTRRGRLDRRAQDERLTGARARRRDRQRCLSIGRLQILEEPHGPARAERPVPEERTAYPVASDVQVGDGMQEGTAVSVEGDRVTDVDAVDAELEPTADVDLARKRGVHECAEDDGLAEARDLARAAHD